MREDWRREKAGGFLAGGGVAVVPAVCGQGVREPGVDVGLDVPAGSPGELVSDGFVSGTGFGLLQGAELAQRLELVGTGRDAGGFAQLGFPGGGGRGVGGEFGPDGVVGVQVADGARGGVGEQLGEALPLRELRRPRTSSARSSCRDACRVSNRASSRAAATAPAAIPFARRRTTRRPMRAGSTGSRGTATRGASGRRVPPPGGHILVIFDLAFVVRNQSGPPPERCTATRRIAL
ncbi:hypothetical protein ACVV2G_27320 [Streptomyces ziwulingensis]